MICAFYFRVSRKAIDNHTIWTSRADESQWCEASFSGDMGDFLSCICQMMHRWTLASRRFYAIAETSRAQ